MDIPNTTYDILWNSNIPLKIKVSMWLVLQDKILTENLLKKGWYGDISCPFCCAFETSDHSFVTCPIASSLWSWITSHNSFNFNFTSIIDLWQLDAWIPLKDKFLIEMIKAATI